MTLKDVEKKHGVFVDHISVRIGKYIQLFIFLAIFVGVIRFFNTQKLGLVITGNYELDNLILFLALFVPGLWYEWRVRNYRKKNNVSIYDNVAKEIYEKYYSNSNNFDKKHDLNYWYDLKEKGAITPEEYENKKREFLNV